MAELVHRDDARKFVVGTLTLAVIAVIAWVGVTVQGGGELPGKDYTYVKAAFHDVGMLKPEQDVSQSGVRIGKVDDIEYSDGRAIVTMRLDGARVVYRNAAAEVINESALGRKQVSLDPGSPSAGRLGGQTIAASRTTDSSTLDDVFSVFDGRTRKAVQTSLRELGTGLAGHSADLHNLLQSSPALLDNVGRISRALSAPEADLPALLESADRLAGRFENRQQELGSLLRQMDHTLRAVNVQDGAPLGYTIQAMPATLRQAREGLQAMDRPLSDTTTALATMRAGTRATGHAAENLRGFLRESVVPLAKVRGVSQQAKPAVGSLTRTFADARSLAPRVARTLAAANVLLQDLAPFAPDVGRFFSEHDLLSGQFAPGKHYFSAMLVKPGAYTASARDPMADTRPYPQPGGGAWRDNSGSGGDR